MRGNSPFRLSARYAANAGIAAGPTMPKTSGNSFKYQSSSSSSRRFCMFSSGSATSTARSCPNARHAWIGAEPAGPSGRLASSSHMRTISTSAGTCSCVRPSVSHVVGHLLPGANSASPNVKSRSSGGGYDHALLIKTSAPICSILRTPFALLVVVEAPREPR